MEIDGVHYLQVDKHLSFYKLALSFLMEVSRHAKSTQNRELVIFLQCLKKKYLILPAKNKKLCIQKVTGDKFF